MAKPPSKAVRKAAEAMGLLKKTGTLKAADVMGTGDLLKLDDLSQYDVVAGKADADTLARTPQDVQNQLDLAKVEEREADRLTAIKPGHKEVEYKHQTSSTEEYQGRWEQFRDPDFASNATMSGTLSDNDGVVTLSVTDFDNVPAARLVESEMKFWKQDADKMLPALTRGPSAEGLRAFTKDTALTRAAVYGDTDPATMNLPAVFFHGDEMLDPRMGELGAIQFTPKANESGMHLGSATATRGITDKRQGTTIVQGLLTDTFKRLNNDISDSLGMEIKLDEVFTRALKENHDNLFLRQGELPKATIGRAEVEDIIKESFEDIKFYLEEVAQSVLQDNAKVLNGLVDAGAITPSAKRNAINLYSKSLFDSINGEDLARRVGSFTQRQYNSVGYPMVANVKNGIFLPDMGGNSYSQIANAILMTKALPSKRLQLLEVIKSRTIEEGNTKLWALLEEAGFDHIVYVNKGENKGVPSIIVWDRSRLENLYSPSVGSPKSARDAAFSVLFGGIGLELGLDNDG